MRASREPRQKAFYKGRPASIDAAQVRAMTAEGTGATEIAKALSGRAKRLPSPTALQLEYQGQASDTVGSSSGGGLLDFAKSFQRARPGVVTDKRRLRCSTFSAESSGDVLTSPKHPKHPQHPRGHP
jgi:hypothetical protein